MIEINYLYTNTLQIVIIIQKQYFYNNMVIKSSQLTSSGLIMLE